MTARTTPVATETTNPDELDAIGLEKIAEGYALRAQARRMRSTPGADELLDRSRVEAAYPIRFRVVTDAARRGELPIEHAGRKPVVRRSALEAWIASRRTAAPVVASLSPREVARAAVAQRAQKRAS